MFLPPEQRHPGPSPWNAQPPKREPKSSKQTVVLWLIGVLLVVTVIALMQGSTVLEALWYVLSH